MRFFFLFLYDIVVTSLVLYIVTYYKMYRQDNNRGVSPVIGIILLLALTVALVALSSNIIFDVADSTVSTSPDIDIETVQMSTNDIETTILQNENVDEIYIVNEDGAEIGGPRISDVGDTYVVNSTTDDFELGDDLSIVVVMNDSDESILNTFKTNDNN